jgi:hypothetical protein
VFDFTSNMTDTLERLEPRRQAALLVQVAHNLTVSARNDRPDDGFELERLRRFNELQHLLSGQVCHLLRGNERRYPTRVLLDILVETAGTDSIGDALSESIHWAFSRALDQNG